MLLRRLWPPRFAFGFDQFAALIAVNLAVWVMLDALHAEPQAEFMADGLFGWACYLLLALMACALVARVQNRDAPTRTLLIPALAVSPYVLTLFWLLGDVAWIADRPLGASIVAVLYLAFLAVRVLGAACGPVRVRTALVAVALVVVSPWVFGLLNLDTRLWVAPDTEQGQDEEDTGATEALFYDQPSRIASAVARVMPSQSGRARAYFVGFAGDGDPAVFRREALFAKAAFAGRFGSEERSVLLINDLEDRDSWPLASVSALAQTLKILAGRMDPEQDVLILFLTSHGSQDGLEVKNGSLPLAQMAPEDLRQALDESGIRWRVVVVSACYAGVFIDALKNDTTAVVTAADAQHSSFGCEEDRDLTWFGEAFLKEALPGSGSLEDAFATAAKLIAQREAEQHEVHSNPQLFMGARMRAKLRALDGTRPAVAGRGAYTVRR